MRDGQTWRRHVDHLKKLHTNPETKNGDENSNSDADSWELPSSTPSNNPETESGGAERNGVEPDPADELPNTSENEADEAEASSGTSTRRYPSRAHHPPDYYSQ